MQTVRSLSRALGALSVALLATLLAAVGPLVAAAPSASASAARTAHGFVAPLSISITSMTPFAKENTTVKISGTLANHTGSAQQGITVAPFASTGSFSTAQEMTRWSKGTDDAAFGAAEAAGANTDTLTGSVANGQTVTWSVSFPASDLQATRLGVFPVSVQAVDGGGDSAIAHTFLPYWPSGSTATATKGLQAAWVWPLIDTPQQSACGNTLATNELAASVGTGGRLSTLLQTGTAWSQKDDLTWAIDPALLSDVSVMTRPYATEGTATCTGRFSQPASPAAADWLNGLKSVTSAAGSSSFLTPYADVDVAALSHAGQDDIVKSAYQLGVTVANQVMPRTFSKDGGSSGAGVVLNAAMPADGQADMETLGGFNAKGGVDTVLVSSAEQSSSAPGEDALASTVSVVGGRMSVLYANSRITSLLGTASPTASPSSQFNLTQSFLAQTALIAAESSTARSLVIEPPAGWKPSAAEANALLSITKNSPWLHVTGLSALSSAAQSAPTAHLPAQQISPGELSDVYMDQVSGAATGVTLFKDLLSDPPASEVNQLNAAVAVTASSAWRGPGLVHGRAVLRNLAGSQASYLADAWSKVKLIASQKILLTGQSGQTTVSVQNGLDQPIAVQVTGTAIGSDLQMHAVDPVLKVAAAQRGVPGSNSEHMSIGASTLGTTRVELQLSTANGLTLPGKSNSRQIFVDVTRVGRQVLIIIAAALGILVLTSVYRVRRKRAADARRESADEMVKAGGTG